MTFCVEDAFHLRFRVEHEDAIDPKQFYKNGLSAYKIFSCQDLTIPSKGVAVCDVGICVDFPGFHIGFLCDGGLGLFNIHVLAGFIKSDKFLHRLSVPLVNLNLEEFNISKGEKIADLFVVRHKALKTLQCGCV